MGSWLGAEPLKSRQCGVCMYIHVLCIVTPYGGTEYSVLYSKSSATAEAWLKFSVLVTCLPLALAPVAPFFDKRTPSREPSPR